MSFTLAWLIDVSFFYFSVYQTMQAKVTNFSEQLLSYTHSNFANWSNFARDLNHIHMITSSSNPIIYSTTIQYHPCLHNLVMLARLYKMLCLIVKLPFSFRCQIPWEQTSYLNTNNPHYTHCDLHNGVTFMFMNAALFHLCLMLAGDKSYGF